ncbi:MAG: alpha-amylase family glycosyl hydrolase [Chloroflexota bacterium]
MTRRSGHGSLTARTPRFAAALVAAVLVGACQQSAVSPSPVQGGAASGSPGTTASPPGPPACDPAPTPESARPWWSDEIFYEVFVRSFQDSDDDGIGDLAGLTNRLDHLNDGDPATTDDLGVTALWLMPVAESPSYHGYDVVDYEAIEGDYGTADDFRALIAAAHDRGIKVIVDLVMNHTSRDHPWFQDALAPGSAHEDWYLWAADRPFARADGARVWHEAEPGRYYYGYFWEGMPDLNLENPDVTAALNGVARFWLEDMGVDGFRLDAARHLIEAGDRTENTDATFEWLRGFRERLHTDHPEALVLGEVWDVTALTSRYVEEGSLDLVFDFGLASSTITSLNSRSGGSLVTALRDVADAYPPDGLATFLANHDQNRVASQLAGDLAAQRLAATLLLTGPGVPFIYYGEEIGMTGSKPDEQIRTPMRWDATSPGAGFTSATPWEPLSADQAGTDVATQSGDPESLLSTYRRLTRLRAAHPALLAGLLVPVESAEPQVVAFLRTGGGETVLVAANVGVEPVASPSLSLAAGPLCGVPAARALLGPDALTAPSITSSGGFVGYVPIPELGPREAIVIELGP